MVDFSRNRRTSVVAAIYAAIIALSYYAAYELRFDLMLPSLYAAQRLHTVWVVVGLGAVVWLVMGVAGVVFFAAIAVRIVRRVRRRRRTHGPVLRSNA